MGPPWLHCHRLLGIPGVESVHEADEVAASRLRANPASAGLPDDGKGIQHEAAVPAPSEPIEMEVKGVEAGAQVAASSWFQAKGGPW